MHRRVVLGEVGEGGHVGDRFELGRVVRLARDIFLRLMMEVVLLLLVGFQRLRHGGRRRVVVRVGFVVTLGFVPFRGSCSRVVRFSCVVLFFFILLFWFIFLHFRLILLLFLVVSSLASVLLLGTASAKTTFRTAATTRH